MHTFPQHAIEAKMVTAAAAAKSLQSCPTLCDPRDGSPLGSPIPGILQARTLEWVAISSSNAWKWKVKVKSLSRVQVLGTPWTAACHAPPSMGFSRQEYWSGVPLPSPWKSITMPKRKTWWNQVQPSILTLTSTVTWNFSLTCKIPLTLKVPHLIYYMILKRKFRLNAFVYPCSTQISLCREREIYLGQV